MKNKYIFLVVLSFFSIPNAFSQKNTVASGGTASGGGGSSTYTIGQIDYTFHSDSISSISQGVQHAFEVYFLDLENVVFNSSNVNIYPNPVLTEINISMANLAKDNYSFEILDLKGAILYKGILNSGLTQIQLDDISTGLYMIKIQSSKGYIQTYKFIKN